MGSLTSHMLQHVFLMNVLVPLAVIVWPKKLRPRRLWCSWPWATAAQIILIWGWHHPVGLAAAMNEPVLMAVMHLSLASAAAWFWFAIWTMPRDGTWRALFALLVTGKLFCLLGALMVFSPSVLFDFSSSISHAPGAVTLADQHGAGMLMLIACPMSYVVAGVVLASRWVFGLEANERVNA